MYFFFEFLFLIFIDNTYIVSIIGVFNGRIFMVGKDGCLYELVYQVRFINRFLKINYELVIICRRWNYLEIFYLIILIGR